MGNHNPIAQATAFPDLIAAKLATSALLTNNQVTNNQVKSNVLAYYDYKIDGLGGGFTKDQKEALHNTFKAKITELTPATSQDTRFRSDSEDSEDSVDYESSPVTEQVDSFGANSRTRRLSVGDSSISRPIEDNNTGTLRRRSSFGDLPNSNVDLKFDNIYRPQTSLDPINNSENTKRSHSDALEEVYPPTNILEEGENVSYTESPMKPANKANKNQGKASTVNTKNPKNTPLYSTISLQEALINSSNTSIGRVPNPTNITSPLIMPPQTPITSSFGQNIQPNGIAVQSDPSSGEQSSDALLGLGQQGFIPNDPASSALVPTSSALVPTRRTGGFNLGNVEFSPELSKLFGSLRSFGLNGAANTPPPTPLNLQTPTGGRLAINTGRSNSSGTSVPVDEGDDKLSSDVNVRAGQVWSAIANNDTDRMQSYINDSKFKVNKTYFYVISAPRDQASGPNNITASGVENFSQTNPKGAVLLRKISALHLAAAYGRTEIAQQLLDNDADINAEGEFHEAKGSASFTPLGLAYAFKHKGVTKLLADKANLIENDALSPAAQTSNELVVAGRGDRMV